MNVFFPTPREINDTGKYVKIATLSSSDFTLETKGSGEIFNSAVDYLRKSFNDRAAILSNYKGEYKIILTVDPEL